MPPALVWITFTIETPPYNFRERLLHTSDGGQFATPFRDDSFWFGTVQGVHKTKLTIIEFNWRGVKVNSSRAHKLDSGTFRVPFLFVALVFGAIRRGDTWSKSNRVEKFCKRSDIHNRSMRCKNGLYMTRLEFRRVRFAKNVT